MVKRRLAPHSSSRQRSLLFVSLCGLLGLIALGLSVTACDNTGTGQSGPKIQDFNPKKGSPGTRILLDGSGFGTDKSAVTVTFAGTPAPVHGVGNVVIDTEVPEGASDGIIRVVVEGDTNGVTPHFDVIPKGRLAYTRVRGGNKEIYTIMPDGSDAKRVTDNSAIDRAPDWSSTGSRIAFQSDRGESFDIYSIKEDGSDRTLITDNGPRSSTYYEGAPAWSPDDSRIAIEYERDNTDIYTIRPGGPDHQDVSLNLRADGDPDWSPDGSRIVYHDNKDDDKEIVVFDYNGTTFTRLTDTNADDFSPAWSPDGSRIAFVSDRDGNSEIYTMSPDGSDPMRVTNNSAADTDPTWSPDGSWIAFETNRDGNHNIYRIKPDGSEVTRITTWTVFEGDPAWGTTQ